MATPVTLANEGNVALGTAGNPLITSGGTAASGAVNITQVAGASVPVGHGTAATAMRVELPTDGTGQVTLRGDSYANITTSTTTTVKNSAGTVKSVNVNTKGTVASAVVVKDNATVIATIDSLNLFGTWVLNVACATSIVVVTTGDPDVTVTYQ